MGNEAVQDAQAQDQGPAFNAEEVLAAPESHDAATLEKAFGAKGQQTQASAPQQQTQVQAQEAPAFDAAKEIAELKAALKSQQTAFAKELGQARKLQSEYAKLPQTLDQLLEKRLAAANKADLTPEQQLAQMKAEQEGKTQLQALEQYIQQKAAEVAQQQLQAYVQEQQAPVQYVNQLTELAGDQADALMPHLETLASGLLADLNSGDPAKVEQALKLVDAYEANPAAALWQASQMARKAGSAAAPAAAPAQAPQHRGAGAAPRVGGAPVAPAGAPKTLKDMTPADFASGTLDMAQLEKLLGVTA